MRKNKESKKWIFSAVVLAFVSLVQMDLCVQAAEDMDYDNGYEVIVEDDANLLTQEEEMLLEKQMHGIAVYGNVAFKSIDENDRTTESYIKSYYASNFGSDSGTVFLIDMDNRNIWIHSNGAIYNVITKSYADTITDNVYRYASDAEYYTCASEVFEQILTLLEGNKIAQPMKYISNAFLSLIIGLILTYFLVKAMSRAVKPSDQELLQATRNGFKFDNVEINHSHTTKRYDPPSSSSGGGGRSGGGGGGGHSF